jgi:PKD repeat protein
VHHGFVPSPQCTFTLGLETNTMRFSPVLTVALGAALLAACGGDSNGPSNTPSNIKPTARFTYACADLDCTFTNESSDDDGSVTASAWTFGDANSTANTSDATHSFSGAGTYTVGLTVTDDSAATNATSRQVTVTVPAPGGLKAGFDVTCTSLDCTVTNTTTGTGSAVTWAWDFGDGSQTSNLQNPPAVHYDVTTLTTFTITLVVTSDGATSQATKQVTPTPAATLTCGDVACTLGLDQAATVVVTLTDRDCETHGNTFVITAPVVDTLFTDGCFADKGTPFTLNGGAAFAAGTQLDAEVLTGVAGAQNPKLRVTGTFVDGWTLEFDDGFVGPGEPDFNDLVITVKATPQ